MAGKKILLVEDDLLSSELVRVTVEAEGSEVRTVARAAAALATLQEWLPDVIISDLGLPDEDGFSLIKKIRSLPDQKAARVPAVALTGYGREQGLQAMAAGFDIYKSKPMDPATLVTLLEELLKT